MASISLQIKADSTQALKALKDFDKATDELKTGFEKLQNEFKDKSIDRWQQKIGTLKTTYNLLGDSTTGLYKTKAALKTSLEQLIRKGVDPTDKRVKFLSESYKKVKGQTDKLAASNKTASVSFTGLIKSAAGITAVYYSIRGLATSLGGAFRASREFTNEIKNVQTLTEELTFREIRDGIKALPPVLGEAKDLTNGLYQALSAGIEPAQAISFVGDAARFAKAGLTETNTAVDVITTALNAYGLSAAEAGKVSDLFFKTIEKGKTTGQELANSIGASIPLFSSAGISLEELNSGLATLTLTGTKTNEATTQLNALVTAFLKPSAALTDVLIEQGHASGGALLQAEGLKGALDLLMTSTGGNTDEIAELLPNVRALRGALGLMTQQGDVYTDVLESMKNATGATDIAFSKQVDAIDMAKASLDRAKLAFGEFVENIVVAVAPTIEKLAVAFSKLDFSAIAIGIGSIGAAWIAASTAAKIAAVGFKSALISTGIGAIVVAIGSLIAYTVHLYKTNEKAQRIIKIAWEGIKVAVVSVALAIVKSLSIITKPLSLMITGMQKLAQLVAPNSQIAKMSFPFISLADTITEKLSSSISGGVEKIKLLSQELREMKTAGDETVQVNEEIAKSIANIPTTTNIAVGSTRSEVDIEKLKADYDKALNSYANYIHRKKRMQVEMQEQQIKSLRVGAEAIQLSINQNLGGFSQILSSAASGYSNILSIMEEDIESSTGRTLEIMSATAMSIADMMSGVSQAIRDTLSSQYAWEEYEDKKALKKKTKIIDKETKTKIDQLKKLGLSIEDYEEQKKIIEEQAQAKKDELEKKAAQTQYDRTVQLFNIEKAFKIATIALDSAAAVLKVWATTPDPTGITQGIMTGIIAGIAAAQIGIVSAQKPPPPPVFASGVDSFVVPPGYNDDNFNIGVRSGERVTVDPTGEETSETIQLTINIGAERLYKEIQRGINNKNIVIGM